MTSEKATSDNAQKGYVIKGMPASPGKARGIARIIKDPTSKEVSKNTILVAEITDPSFVPIMAKSAAIVTDYGGITSHPAIVARELGIPCVVGTENATEIIKDGDLIEVDGTNGLVKKL